MSKRIPKKKPLDRYPYMDNDLKNWENQWVPTEIYALYVEQTNAKLDDLQTQIDNIDTSGYLPRTEFDEYVSTTSVTLTNMSNSIQTLSDRLNNITADFVTNYEFNTYKTETATTLQNLQDQIDNIDLSVYVTYDELTTILDENYVDKTTYNTYVTNTATTLTSLDGRITANETAIQSMETDISNLETEVTNLKIKRITLTTTNTVSDTTVPNYKFSQEFNVPGVTADTFPDGYVDSNITGRLLIETLTDKIKLYFATKPATTGKVVVIYHNTYT